MLPGGGAAAGEATAVAKVVDAEAVDATGNPGILGLLVTVEAAELVEGPSAKTPPEAEGEVVAELAPSANTPPDVVAAAAGATAVTAPGAEVSPRFLYV